MGRTILHIDLNSFFASCLQQDNFELRGKPVGVVQDSGKRGVIIGSSREAKMIGINTGCLVWEARKIYPDIKIVPADFDRFLHYARLLRKICRHYTDQMEIFSIDEVFVDVTSFKDPVKVAREIKERIKVSMGSQLSVSIGVADNKILAKLASDCRKPDGLVVVNSKDKLKFLDQFNLTDICGIASRIERRLNRLGIYTIKQLRQAPVEALVKEFGIMGRLYSDWAHGRGDDVVINKWQVPEEKSFGNQVTLAEDLKDKRSITQVMLWLSWQVAARMREKSMGAKTVNMSLRGNHQWAHKQFSPKRILTNGFEIYEASQSLYKKMEWQNPVRFMSISVSNLESWQNTNLSLFNFKREQLSLAWDKVAKKYGAFYLRPASLLYKTIKESNLNGFTKRF